METEKIFNKLIKERSEEEPVWVSGCVRWEHLADDDVVKGFDSQMFGSSGHFVGIGRESGMEMLSSGKGAGMEGP